MIDDSGPWRQEIARRGIRLVRLALKPSPTRREFVQAERDVLLGLFSIRKLYESHKTSSNLDKLKIRVDRFVGVDSWLTQLNTHHIDRHFDFHRRKGETRPIDLIWNQAIHSWFLLFVRARDEWTVALSSDKQKKKSLFCVPLTELSKVFDLVAREEIVKMHYEINPETGEETSIRISNHDLVRQQQAEYGDASKTWVNLITKPEL